jgi:polysaccharide biosynthesis protein PelE
VNAVVRLSRETKRWTAVYGLVLPAVVFEAAAVSVAVQFGTSTLQFAWFLALHLVASLLLAFAVRMAMPARYANPWLPASALLAALAFFIPLLGLIGIVAALLIATLLPSSRQYRPFVAVRAPEYMAPTQETRLHLRPSGLRSLLLDTTLPVEIRVKALTALQNMPPRVAVPILRRLLSDPADDLRLAAYALIDGQEKRLAASIREELAQLPRVTEPAARVNCLRRLAELHWELVYGGLVQGDLRRITLDAGMDYVHSALVLAAREPGLWFLEGRFRQAKRQYGEAAQAYALATAVGLPEARVLPYLAEVLYEERRFDDVRRCMTAVAATQRTPAMAPLIRFWTAASAPEPAPRGDAPALAEEAA